MAIAEQLRTKLSLQLNALYVDVVDDDLDEYPEVEQYLSANDVKLPLITVNGKIYSNLELTYQALASVLEVD